MVNSCFLISSNVINGGEFLHPSRSETAVMLHDKRENDDLQSFPTFIQFDAEQRGENESSNLYVFFVNIHSLCKRRGTVSLLFGGMGVVLCLRDKKNNKTEEIPSDVESHSSPAE